MAAVDPERVMSRACIRQALVCVLALAAGCGGSSGGGSVEVLPDGDGDPRAYTERYLAEHPGATLRLSHLAILDVAPGEGADRLAYLFDAPTALRLEVAPDAATVDALILRDGRGRTVARSGQGSAPVQPGRHRLAVRPRADLPAGARQTVFLRAVASADGSTTLRASQSCTNCSFDGAMLAEQNFDGADLSGSTFRNASISDSSFRGATMVDCDLSGEVVPTSIEGCDFGGANLSGARFDFVIVGQTTIFGGPSPTPPANLANTSWGAVPYTDDLYAVGELDGVVFANATLSGARFTGPALIEVDFRGADLSGADFTATGTLETGGPRQTQCGYCDFSTEPSTGNRTDLRNAVLSAPGVMPLSIMPGNSFSGARFGGAQLAQGSFAGLDFSNADFTQATLSRADLTGATLNGAVLSGARLDYAVLDGALLEGTAMDAATFDHASLQGLDLYARDLHGLDFSGASLVGSVLDYADLAGANLSGAMLGVPDGATAEPASLIRAYMPNVDLSSADLRNVDLSGAHLYGDAQQTSLDQALLDGATLVGAICSGTEFTDASLTGAVLDGAQLVNTTFAGADLTDASLDSTYLQGADFSGAASVANMRLSNAAVATAAGIWTFTEQNGMPVEYVFGATDLGAIATRTDVICPNGEPGPCVGAKLTPVMNGPFPPIPTCVPLPPNYNNCTAPTPTPTPP